MQKRQYFLWSLLVCVLFFVLVLMVPPSSPPAEPAPTFAAGTKRECKVTWDRFEVPHIQADTNEAAMFCWGKLQALARAWQMDYLRRVAYGRMAELYGQRFIRQDFFFRLLGFKRVAERWLGKEFEKENRPLRYYVAGVNAGFREVWRRKKRPYQYRKYGMRLAPWRLLDTFMIALLQSFYQTRKTFTDDLRHARLRAKLGNKRYLQLYKTDKGYAPFQHDIIKTGEHPLVPARKAAPRTRPSSRPASVPTKAGETKGATPSKRAPATHPARQPRTRPPARGALRKGWRPSFGLAQRMVPQGREGARRWAATLGHLIRWMGPMGTRARGMGSNNWVVAPSRSKSGHALLANDPHLAITTPAFWHEVHLKTPQLDVLGVNVPGVPAIVSGNNRHVAWGVTNGYSNVADVVAIKPNADKTSFTLGKKTYRIETFRPVVRLRLGSFYLPVFWKTFQRSDLGPILPFRGPKGEVLLLRWSGFHITSSPFRPGLKMLTARSVKEMDRALQQWTTPCWNLVFADTKGNIGYRQVGLLPKRLAGPTEILDPKDARQRWRGFLGPHETPALQNPKRGYIATANNRAFPAHYPFFAGHTFLKGHRARRIEELLKLSSKHTLKTMQRIQKDIQSPDATYVLALMLKHLKQSKAQKTPMEQQAIGRLSRWDLHASREKVAPTLFRRWLDFLEVAMFAKDKVRPGTWAILRVLQEKIPAGTKTPLPALLHQTLKQTLTRLKKDLGPKLAQWRWGRYHRQHFRSLLAGARAWSPKSQPMDGDDDTVNVAPAAGKGPYRVSYAASLRLVVELGPRIRSFGVVASKQRDLEPTKLGPQQKLWLHNRYRPRPFYPDEIQRYKHSTSLIKF